MPADAAKAKTKLDDTLAELKEAAETTVEETANDAQDAAKAVTDDVVAKTGEMVDSLTDTKSTENTDDALFVDETTQEGAGERERNTSKRKTVLMMQYNHSL